MITYMDGLHSQSAGKIMFFSRGFFSFTNFFLEVSHFPIPVILSLATGSETTSLCFTSTAGKGSALKGL